jgi:hypothetical protein
MQTLENEIGRAVAAIDARPDETDGGENGKNLRARAIPDNSV